MATENLQIPDIAASQSQKEVTANAAHNLLDRAANKNVQKTITGADTFTVTETRENMLIELTGTPGSAFTVNMPDTNKRTVAVLNNTGQVATIRNSAGAGADQPVIADAAQSLFHYDGVDFTEIGGGGGAEVFTGLTDTPVSYSGQGLKPVRVNSGANALEFFTDGGGAGRAPFKGALVKKDANQTGISTTFPGTALTWEAEEYDTGTFHDNVTNNERITVPAGSGIVRVRLSANVVMATDSNDKQLAIFKNGVEFPGSAQVLHASDGTSKERLNITTPVISVAEGDFFEVFAWQNISTGTVEFDDETWFAMEVVEDGDTANYDFHGWRAGVPTVSVVVQRFVAPRAISFAVDFPPSEGHAGTAPSAATSFDIQKNGGSIGSMDFASAATVATFTVASTTDLAAGDRLEIIAPANLNGLADLSFTLAGVL